MSSKSFAIPKLIFHDSCAAHGSRTPHDIVNPHRSKPIEIVTQSCGRLVPNYSPQSHGDHSAAHGLNQNRTCAIRDWQRATAISRSIKELNHGWAPIRKQEVNRESPAAPTFLFLSSWGAVFVGCALLASKLIAIDTPRSGCPALRHPLLSAAFILNASGSPLEI